MSENGPGPAKQLFEDAVASLDAGTTNRLRLMRRQALSQPHPRRVGMRLLPAVAFGAALLALSLAWRFESAPTPSPAAADTELALGLPEDEDAALYAWLGEAPVAAEGETL